VSKSRKPLWLAVIFIPIGLLLALVLGVFGYMIATAKPLHPDPQQVPSVTHVAPSPKWTATTDKARQVVRSRLIEQNLPGVSVAVGVAGETVWTEGFGWADLEKRVPLSPNQRFRIGTASTVLTSAAVGLLLERNKLNLDDEIQAYVPEFPKKQWPVTLRQLMGHVAGVRNDSGDEGPLFSQRCKRPVEALPFFADRPLLFEPGTEFRHSSYGWILVSAAIEAAAGQGFVSFMQSEVFEPLGMHDTRPESLTEPIPDRVTPYFPRFAGDPKYGPDPMRELDLSCYSGSSVFLSTPSDLVRFGMALTTGKLLQPSTVQSLQTSQRLRSGEETGYGLGWDLETVTLGGEQAHVVGHHGDILGGMAASLMILRERGIVVAVTSNTSYSDTVSLASKIMEIFGHTAKSPAAFHSAQEDEQADIQG
jgi:CubicO group peptidase (beta-lactamase class C family)